MKLLLENWRAYLDEVEAIEAIPISEKVRQKYRDPKDFT